MGHYGYSCQFNVCCDHYNQVNILKIKITFGLFPQLTRTSSTRLPRILYYTSCTFCGNITSKLSGSYSQILDFMIIFVWLLRRKDLSVLGVCILLKVSHTLSCTTDCYPARYILLKLILLKSVLRTISL